MHDFFMSPLVKAMITGLITAAGVDLHAFFAFKGADDFIHYKWSVAVFRWGQGLVSGLVVGLGYGALIG